MSTVAALYIDPRGPYPWLAQQAAARKDTRDCVEAIDCWDESRDARKYDGPHPIVAHPPCGPWGRLRHLYRGNEHDCAPRAVEQVRRWGGVLEHPAGSLLWVKFEIPGPLRPGEDPCADYCSPPVDEWGGYTIAVDQCEWGHVAQKRTWLYLVGVPRDAIAPPPFPDRAPTHYVSGGRTISSRRGGAVPPGIKVCSAQQRRRTPPAFAEWLVRLARAANTRHAH